MMCSNDMDASSSWIPYFFFTDGMKSFHDGLSDKYHRSCRVPYEYTTQVHVLGRNGYISVDNVWRPEEVHLNWQDIANSLNNHVDKILIIGHWDCYNDGGKSIIKDWIKYLSPYFKSKEIIGIQGHTHINKIENYNNIKLITAGGNGFRGSGCNCNGGCNGCHCCCPTLYKNNKWIIGGWSDDKLCGMLNNRIEL